VNVPALEQAVTDAQAKLVSAQAGFEAAAGDLTKMLAFADSLKLANREFENAKAKLAQATYDIRKEERMVFAGELKAAVESVIAGFDAMAREFALTGVHVAFGENGTTVSVADRAAPVGKRTVGTKSPKTGVAKGRANILYNGNEYSARDFLLQFGGDAGVAAVRLATKDANDPESWVNKLTAEGTTYAYGPGFDGPKRKLMKELGASFADGSEV
jgi:hypothetical protein